MNLKKALQAFLVTVSCGVLNIAGAQQRPVFIPEDIGFDPEVDYE